MQAPLRARDVPSQALIPPAAAAAPAITALPHESLNHCSSLVFMTVAC